MVKPFPESEAGVNTAMHLANVHKAFGNKHVLRGVTLDVKRGESLVIIGGSGTGKSVLLKCILGLLRPEKGSIIVDGQEIIGLRGRNRDAHIARFGMLFQGGALFDSLPVWRNVAFRLIYADHMPIAAARQRAEEALGAVGLGKDIGALYPAELSGGMLKRVALARAVAARPEILFFDEPTTGLDPIMADVINQLIVQCVKDLGCTAISITHDMASARTIADRIAMLYQGQIIWQGTPSEINASGNAYVDQFIHGRAEGPIHMPLRKL